MVQTMLDDLPPTPEPQAKASSGISLTQQHQTDIPVSAPLLPLTRPSITSTVIPVPSSSQPLMRQPATTMNSIKQKKVETEASQPLTRLVIEKDPLAISTTPPLTDGGLSPTSPTEKLSNSVKAVIQETQNPVKSAMHVPPVLPPHLRSQKTPVKRSHSQARAQHKYSPAVPSPLSRIVKTAESPPSSPESKTQRENQRPPVIPEEDEESEEKLILNTEALETVVKEDTPIISEDMPATTSARPGSLSPLSRIMNMGLSPAIAPTLAISSFPGLLGNGRLTQDLITKPKQTLKGFGDIPGGFQLGAPIQVNSKTTVASMSSKPKVQKPKREVFGEHRSRSSKDSTSSSGSDGKSSATSSKKSSAGVRTTNPKLAGGMRNKENDAKKLATVTAPNKATSFKRPVAPSVPVANKATSKASSIATRKPTSGTMNRALPLKGQKG
jgi:hypothetical protein